MKINLLQEKMEILLRLLIAHIITDFFIQPDKWVNDKRENTWKSKFLYIHVLLTGLVAWLFLWDWNLWHVALFIMTTHLLIDLYKLIKDAGIWIGILERILVVTFVLFNQFQAIGFLIAAKSILRFSDRSEDNPRKQTEYVLIGTLISFTIALFIGLIIKSIGKI